MKKLVNRSLWLSWFLFFCTLSGEVFARNNELEDKLKKAFAAGDFPGLHSVLVMREDTILAEAHFPGNDESWGVPLGDRIHGSDSLHDLRSVTKSLVGLLYGIALQEGIVPDINEPLIDQFPEYKDLASDSQRQSILVRHALSMTMGTEWNEDLPYTDSNNSEIAMEMAADRYRFVLDRPLIHKPGKQWTYNGGATAIIAKLIADGAGKSIESYANEKLFKPLGITSYEWIRGHDNVPSAASGLRLNSHDLAKIGQLVLNQGIYEGKQIVPADWLKASFIPQATLETGLRYGFFWWLALEDSPPRWVAGFGNGGQRLTIDKRNRIVIVIFAGNYNQPDAWEIPVKVIVDIVYPSIFDS